MIHTNADAHAAWRVWHDRRQQVKGLLYERYPYIERCILDSIQMQIEYLVTSDQTFFERAITPLGEVEV